MAGWAALRRSYPRWSHQALLNKVWPNRPIGASAYEMIEIAEEFKLPEIALASPPPPP